MVKIAPFAVEHWMDDHETSAKFNLAETCCASISLEDLIELSENKDATKQGILNTSTKLTYGSIRGADKLRSNLASRYSARSGAVEKDDVLVTNGGIVANFLALYALVSAGDHVICQYPTYEQLYQVPASLGAEVSLWKMNSTKKWALDLEELKSMIKDNTSLLILNNPNNPTGAIIPNPQLEDIVELAQEKNIRILCDEVYRPVFHSILPSDENFPPSAINLGYKKVVVTGSFSKAYSLAGIRVGWVVTRDKEALEMIAASRHYTTISVSQLDQAVAAEAIGENCIHALLGRNLNLARTNLALVEEFLNEHQWACSWVKPVAGSVCLIKFHKMGKSVDDVKFCEILQDKTGVMLVPASKCFGNSEDFKGHIRLGFVQETQVMKDGLAALKGFMEEHYEDVPTLKKT